MTKTTATVPFSQAVIDLEEIHKAGLLAFVLWLQTNWLHDSKTQWQSAEPWPGDDHQNGWNQAINSLAGALDTYISESA